MRGKPGRTIRTLFYGAVIMVLLGLSCVGGICIEREYQKFLEEKKEYAATIAVVNMDDGVSANQAQVNYASQLISFPNENFTVTGLTDARTGIENGTYAAYIIIPETFSVSVTSIENNPRKVALEYRYNPNLAETARMQAMNDVNDFIAMLNSNISYMYIDAVLTEFHRIQDDSLTILSNDNAELELLENVNAGLLIEAAERVEETVVDGDIQPVELDPYAQQNDALLDSMLLKYMEAVQQAQNDYTAIEETRGEVNTASDQFFTTYNAIVYDTNAEHADILSEGRSNLVDAVGIYNRDIDEQRRDVENLIEELINGEEAFANEQLDEILEDINTDREEMLATLQEAAEKNLDASLKSCQEEMEEWLEDIAEESYRKGFEAAASVSDNTINEEALEDYITALEIEKKLGEITEEIRIDWEKVNSNQQTNGGTGKPEDTGSTTGAAGNSGAALGTTEGADSGAGTEEDADDSPEPAIEYQISLSENSAGTAEEIVDLFRLKYDTDEIDGVIQTCFVDRLRDVHQGQMEKLDEAAGVLSRSMDGYEARLESYDPMSYIQSADLDAYLDNIEVNARDMLWEVEQNNSEYRTYAEEVYYATSEHTSQLVDSLNAANTQTTTNIENCIDGLKESRLEINGQNIELLEKFTEALAYTRVGSQDNVEAYDYIVNPVISGTIGEAVPAADTAEAGKSISIKILLVIFLGIGMAVCLAGVLSGIWRQRRKPEEEKRGAY